MDIEYLLSGFRPSFFLFDIGGGRLNVNIEL